MNYDRAEMNYEQAETTYGLAETAYEWGKMIRAGLNTRRCLIILEDTWYICLTLLMRGAYRKVFGTA